MCTEQEMGAAETEGMPQHSWASLALPAILSVSGMPCCVCFGLTRVHKHGSHFDKTPPNLHRYIHPVGLLSLGNPKGKTAVLRIYLLPTLSVASSIPAGGFIV